MGGNAVPLAGTITKSEVFSTIKSLEESLMVGSLSDRFFGSTGKAEYSGDIDIVVDEEFLGMNRKEFHTKLVNLYGRYNVANLGSCLSISYPIAEFDNTKLGRLPRTGYVQIDFTFGDKEFTKFFNHSPGDSSVYKGVHRNISISAICGVTDRLESLEKDDQGRSIEIHRYKWSQYGLSRIRRISVFNEQTNRWNKSQKDENIGDSILDPLQIAQTLFGKEGIVEDLNSLETLIAAMRRHFDEEKFAMIAGRMLHNFEEYNERSEKTNLAKYGIPPELLKYQDI